MATQKKGTTGKKVTAKKRQVSAKPVAKKSVSKKRVSKKKTVAKKAPAKKSVAKKKTGPKVGAKSVGNLGGKAGQKSKKKAEGIPKDLHKRQWGKPGQLIEWLKADGFPLSRQNLYKIYGPKSKIPVKLNSKGEWSYPELLERVMLNRGESFADNYDAVNDISLARARAELRIKEAEAKDRELSLGIKEGNLVEMNALELALNMAAQTMETRRKSLCASLPAQLAGLDVLEMNKLLDLKTKELFEGLLKTFEESADGC